MILRATTSGSAGFVRYSSAPSSQTRTKRALLGFAAEHDHRRVEGEPLGAHRLEHLEAVEARHHQVEHHAVGRSGPQLVECIDAVLRLPHLEALVAQREGEHSADIGVVVDDQHLGTRGSSTDPRVDPDRTKRLAAGSAGQSRRPRPG